MTRTLTIILALVIVAGAADRAWGQQACPKRTVVINHLANKYSEAPAAIGLANNGGVIEVLTAPVGSTWTIILTMPDGTSCMIAAGENWQRVPKGNGT